MRIKFTYYKTDIDAFYQEHGTKREGEVLSMRTTKTKNLILTIKEDGAQPKSFNTERMTNVSTFDADVADAAPKVDLHEVWRAFDNLSTKIADLEYI